MTWAVSKITPILLVHYLKRHPSCTPIIQCNNECTNDVRSTAKKMASMQSHFRVFKDVHLHEFLHSDEVVDSGVMQVQVTF